MTNDALSPLDGRYASQVEPYAAAFSEEALFRQRFRVEVEWLLNLASEPAIAELPLIGEDAAEQMRSWRDIERIANAVPVE